MEVQPQKPLTMEARRAHAAYDADCVRQGVQPSDSARAEFVREWLQCAEEDRQDGIEAQQRDLIDFIREGLKLWDETPTWRRSGERRPHLGQHFD